MSKTKQVQEEEKKEQGPHKDWQLNVAYAKDYFKHFAKLLDIDSVYPKEIVRYIDIERNNQYPWILWILTAQKGMRSAFPVFFHVPYRDFVENIKEIPLNHA